MLVLQFYYRVRHSSYMSGVRHSSYMSGVTILFFQVEFDYFLQNYFYSYSSIISWVSKSMKRPYSPASIEIFRSAQFILLNLNKRAFMCRNSRLYLYNMDRLMKAGAEWKIRTKKYAQIMFFLSKIHWRRYWYYCKMSEASNPNNIIKTCSRLD